MGRFILGIVVGIILVFGGIYFYFTSGMAPVAATAKPMPFETYFTNAALAGKMFKEEPKTVPIQATPANLIAGAQIYKTHCAFCHGLPNAKSSREGDGMFPPAPQLFTPDGDVTDDDPGLTYWKVKNGIRLTGMPSFGAVLNNQQMWQVTLMLGKVYNLPAAASAELASTPAAPSAGSAPAKPSTGAKSKGR